MRMRLIYMAVFALVAVVAVACSSGDSATATPATEGTLAGRVTIGPLCPVEPCNSTTNPYPGHEIVVRDADGVFVAAIPLNDDGTFLGTVPVGEFEVELEPCEFLGCQFGSPTSVSVKDGERTVLDLDIDTGIR